MEPWLNVLESIDNPWLPPLLLAALLLLTPYFVYSAFNARGAGRRREVNNMSSDTRDSMLSTTQSLREVWQGKREFYNVLRGGVLQAGPFKGWFADEDKMCRAFKDTIAGIGKDVDPYPGTEIEYLQIVSEIDRAPKPWWVWGLLGVMVVGEAYGFSVLLAGYLNDKGAAWVDDYVAVALSTFFAVGALFSAWFIGTQAYKQAYARRVWKDSNHQILTEVDGTGGNGSTHLSKALGVTAEDNEADKHQRQATRMANRSEYVKQRAAETRGVADKNIVPLFRNWFWIYVAGVCVFGVFVVVVRTMAISDNYKRELSRAQDIAASETTAPATASGGVRPDAVNQQNAAAAIAVTQESLEQTRDTKIVVTYVYMLLFFVVQTVAVLFTARYGFASDEGLKAYEKIRAFRSRYGAVTAEEYAKLIDTRKEGAIREAQSIASATLKNWQIGLQTEYHNGNSGLNEAQRKVIEEALRASADRTYERYVVLSEMPASPQPASGTPARESKASAAARDVAAPASPAPQAHADIEVEFYQRGTNGEEVVQVGALRQLKARVAEAELDAASLMVRPAGQPGRYVSYREFLQFAKGTSA